MKQYNELIDSFKILMDDNCRCEDFLKNLSSIIKLDGIAFQRLNENKNEIFLSYQLDEDILNVYKGEMKKETFFTYFLKGLPERKVLDDKELSREENFQNFISFKNFLKKSKFAHFLISVISKDEMETIIMFLFRGRKKGIFTKKEIEVIKKSIIFFKLTYKYCSKVEILNNYLVSLKKILDWSGRGIIIFDRNRILILNRVAAEILAKNEGIFLTQRGIEISDPIISYEFEKAKKNIFSPKNFEKEEYIFSIPRNGKKLPLLVQIFSITEDLKFQEKGRLAAIILSDPNYSSLPSPDALAKAFNFTPKEREIALTLSRTLDLNQTAEELRIALNTVRTHLKHIYDKTKVSSQAELIKLLTNFPLILD